MTLEEAGIFASIGAAIIAAAGFVYHVVKGGGVKNPKAQVGSNSGVIGTVLNARDTGDINFGLSPAVEKRLLKELDAKDLALEEKEKTLQDLKKVHDELIVQLAERVPGNAERSKARHNLEEGDFEGAEQILRQAYDASGTERASNAYELALLKELQLDYGTARSYFEEAVRLDPGNARHLNRFGVLLELLADHQGAIDQFEKALAITIRALGDDHPDTSAYYNNLGAAWDSLGEYKEAIGLYEKALAIDRKALGEEHPHTAIDYNNLGLAWKMLGEYNKAIGFYEKSLDIIRKALGEEHPLTAIRYSNLGSAWSSRGKYKKATGYYEKALTIHLKSFGEERPDTATYYNNLGSAWNSRGENKKAIGLFEKALAINCKVLGEEHPHTAIDYNNLGVAWKRLREFDRAIGLFEKALCILVKHSSDHPDIQTVRDNIKETRQSTK